MGGKSRKTGGVSAALISRLVNSGGSRATKADTSAPAPSATPRATTPKVKVPKEVAPKAEKKAPTPVPKPSAPAAGMFKF